MKFKGYNLSPPVVKQAGFIFGVLWKKSDEKNEKFAQKVVTLHSLTGHNNKV